MIDNDKRKEHPSYGVAEFSRISSSGNKPLFGSSIGHSQTIELRIHRAEQIRSDSSYDRYHPTEQLIVVEMSQTQFAELITNMNYGSGIPVTIRRLNGERPEDPPVENKRQQHSDEFKQRMVEFSQRLVKDSENLKTFLTKPKLSKEDKRVMKIMFEHLTTEIKNNIPFFERMFEEQMDKTVVEAKGEIEAFITNAVTQTGLETLRKEGLMLGIGENNDE